MKPDPFKTHSPSETTEMKELKNGFLGVYERLALKIANLF